MFRLAISFLSAVLLCFPLSGLAAGDQDDDPLTADQVRSLSRDGKLNADVDDSNGWQMTKVAVDERIVRGAWQEVPFQTSYFDYPPAQLREKWPQLMRAMRVPYPSAEFLRARIEHFPELKAELGAEFNGDYEALSREILHAWRLFFRGDFRASKDHGVKFGAYGKLPAYLSQLIYAVYLCDTRTEKLELLKDVANQVADYVHVLKSMKDVPEFQEDYMVLRLGYGYAIGRIAEEVTPMNALMNNYFFKMSAAVDDVLRIDPQHPVGLAFLAAMDANLIRVLGKFVSRVTLGARLSRVEDNFLKSIDSVDDRAIVHLEYGNSLIYINRTRDIDVTRAQIRKAAGIHPLSAMEALDSMYAAKRLVEVDNFLDFSHSFRSYERHRRNYMNETDENLYNVSRPPFLITEYLNRSVGS
jgi:hypothetical protein